MFFAKDRPQGPPTANHQPLPTANSHQPPTANGDQPPTANHCQPPPITNHQPPTAANCHQPPPTANRQLPIITKHELHAVFLHNCRFGTLSSLKDRPGSTPEPIGPCPPQWKTRCSTQLTWALAA